MASTSHSISSLVQDFAVRIQVEWLVRSLVLVSMMVQLLLVFLGPHRHYTAGAIFRFAVWAAYISADGVAISVLGTMMHNAGSPIYGIWAPVLLVHLGGPDAISAYSMADNELWLRHGLNMIYQVSVAAYVIYSSTLRGQALASAILLFVAGTVKYGERILALWLATYSRIVTSCLPISKYMKDRNVVQRRGYVVMGEKQVERMEEKEGKLKASRDIEAGTEEGRGIVTTEDLQASDIAMKDYELCLSHALFKLYKRRFANLNFEERVWPETRRFWVTKFGGVEAFRIVEMELKFMYDAIFSKWNGVSFSKWGLLGRLLNTSLMGVAGLLILKETKYSKVERTVTYVLISVALAVEVFQLYRIMISDWTRVTLLCARLEQTKWSKKVSEITVVVLDKIRNVVGGDKYRRSRIQQHCLMETCLNSSRFVSRIAGLLPKDIFLVNGYIKARHINSVFVEDELKIFIFDFLKEKFPRQEDDEDKEYARVLIYRQVMYSRKEFKDNWNNLEEVVLMLHIATTMCDMRRVLLGECEDKNVRVSIILSRYCAYLLLSRPNLLPLHPDMARISYLRLVEGIRKIQKSTMGVFGKHSHSQSTEVVSLEDKSTLGAGTNLARDLLELEPEERWDFLAIRVGLVVYMAMYNKKSFHAECLAGGGEFLSQVWVLLGHMGYGEQSDSAVNLIFAATKKVF